MNKKTKKKLSYCTPVHYPTSISQYSFKTLFYTTTVPDRAKRLRPKKKKKTNSLTTNIKE